MSNRDEEKENPLKKKNPCWGLQHTLGLKPGNNNVLLSLLDLDDVS